MDIPTGTFSETLVVDKTLTLQGVSAATPILNNGVHHLGAHTISTKNPLFANPAAADYHLTLGSFAIGLGATNLGVSTDLDGRPRLGRFDSGAYQFYTKVYVPVMRK